MVITSHRSHNFFLIGHIEVINKTPAHGYLHYVNGTRYVMTHKRIQYGYHVN